MKSVSPELKARAKRLSEQKQIQEAWSNSFTNMDLLAAANQVYEACGLKSALEVIEKGKNKPEFHPAKKGS